MRDRIMDGFLREQLDRGMLLARQSDLLDLYPDGSDGANPPQRYLAMFCCRGLVRERGGEIRTAEQFGVGIRFPEDYQRRANTFEVLTWLGPGNVFHPNVRPPLICAGRVLPGTPLVDLLYQVFEIITYNKVTMQESDALNAAACAWARHNQHRFPVDRRALKRKRLQARVDTKASPCPETQDSPA